MKLVVDERVKHRLVGLAVILSIAAIFAPAIMKKSNQRFDSNVNISVELPPKPPEPKVAMAEKKAMFDTVKTAHVEIIDDFEEQEQSLAALSKAEPPGGQGQSSKPAAPAPLYLTAVKVGSLSKPAKEASASAITKRAVIQKIARALPSPAPAARPKSRVIAAGTTVKPAAKAGYAIQLATFSIQDNAKSLVSRLRGKGYKAACTQITTREGIRMYKVLVGQVSERDKAERLQEQLATAVQIRGLIVNAGQG